MSLKPARAPGGHQFVRGPDRGGDIGIMNRIHLNRGKSIIKVMPYVLSRKDI